MSNTPKIDRFYGLIEEKGLPLDARYYHMRTYARKIELELHEQCRLLGMSAERECDLRGKLDRERALADRLAEAANAVIDQWETPNWRLRESTAKYMNTLRNTLTAWKEARSE